MSMKESNDATGNRTRNLPDCNAVPIIRNHKKITRIFQDHYIVKIVIVNTEGKTSLMYRTYSLTLFFLLWRCDPKRVMASSFTRFLDHTQRRTTVGRTPLDR
jgi:hypothetical protein